MTAAKHKGKKKKSGISGHSRVRKTCIWCPKGGHNHTKSGNTHRFHGKGSFCATHKTTKRGKKYCGKGKKSKKR